MAEDLPAMLSIIIPTRPEQKLIPSESRWKQERSNCKRGRSCNHWQLQEEIDESSTLSSDQLERTSDKLYN